MIRTKSICIYLVVVILITSCDYRPIEDMPMIVGIAIDPMDEGYKLTAKVIVPSSAEGQSNQVFIQSSGKTIFDGTRDFIMKEGQKVFWGQLGFIIINEKIAKKDITEVLDFFVRDNEPREDVWLLITKKDIEAEEVIKATYSEKRVRFYVIDALENVDGVGKYNDLRLLEFSNELTAKGIEPVLPLISTEMSLNQKRVIINGGCVFKDNKIIGQLDGKEMKQYRILMNKLPGVYIIEFKDETNDTQVTVEVSDVKRKLKINKKDQAYKINIEVNVIGVVAEIVNNDVKLSNNKDADKFIKQAEEQLNKELQELVCKAQKEFGSDIFGIGEKVKNKDPKEFKKIEDNWNTVFTSLNIKVDTKVKLSGTALVQQPYHEEE